MATAAADPPGTRATWAVPLALGVVWFSSGANFLAFKVAVETIPPFLMIAVRLLVAGALLLPISLLVERGGRPSAAQWRNVAIMAVLLLVIGQGAVVWGVQYLPAGTTAVFVSSTPLWLALFERLRGHPLTWRALLGLGLGFAGLVVLSTANSGEDSVDPVAVAAVLAGAAAWAAGSLVGHDADVPPAFTGTALQMLIAGAVLGAVAVGSGEFAGFEPTQASRRSLLALGYLIVVGSMIGFGGFVWLTHAASPTLTGTFAYVGPVVALALSAWLLDEPLTAPKLGAATLALAGVALMATGARPKQRPCGQ